MKHVGSFGLLCLDDDMSRYTLYFIWTMEECMVVYCNYSVGQMFETYQIT